MTMPLTTQISSAPYAPIAAATTSNTGMGMGGIGLGLGGMSGGSGYGSYSTADITKMNEDNLAYNEERLKINAQETAPINGSNIGGTGMTVGALGLVGAGVGMGVQQIHEGMVAKSAREQVSQPEMPENTSDVKADKANRKTFKSEMKEYNKKVNIEVKENRICGKGTGAGIGALVGAAIGIAAVWSNHNKEK